MNRNLVRYESFESYASLVVSMQILVSDYRMSSN